MNVDKNNFAPRAGFSWAPGSDHKTVVRGGFGIYYSPIYAQIPDVIQTLNDVQIRQTFITLLDQPVNSAAIYQTLLSQGVIGHRQIQESDLAQFGISAGPNSFNSVKFVGAPNYVNPYTEQASLGVERQLGRSLAVSIDYIFVRGAKIPRAREINYVPNSSQQLLNIGAPAGIVGFNEIDGAPIGTGERIDPRFLQLNQYESSANSFYHGLTVTFTKRYSHHFSINANYTFSKAIDEVVDFNSDFSAASAFCQRCERALSSFDQRHRFVFTGVFDSAKTAKRDAGFVNNLLADWQVVPIFIAGSARPFDLLAGVDLNGDNQTNSDRPIIGNVPLGRNTG
ncbi:MAG: TonB-dependent receptor, partial [Blastocatellia bacterium]